MEVFADWAKKTNSRFKLRGRKVWPGSGVGGGGGGGARRRLPCGCWLSTCWVTQVVLLMDNASSHAIPGMAFGEMEGLKTLEFSNMLVVFLPPNTTSAVQPMDQGIIAAFKLRYKRKLLAW